MEKNRSYQRSRGTKSSAPFLLKVPLKTYTLTSKLKLVVEQHAHSVSTAVGIFVNVGSRHEPKGFEGITHLCEHLFFKGTTQKDAFDISRIIESCGGELNAYTDRELTCFHVEVPATKTSLGIALLFEMLFDSIFDEVEFKKRKRCGAARNFRKRR